MNQLKADAVNETFLDCLFKDKPTVGGYVKAEGITLSVGFNPESLAKNTEKIHDFLMQLPSPFHQAHGGGYSFLGACEDSTGLQWTGMHKDMEELFLLGVATGYVKCLLPREIWNSLPGGVPYYVVLTDPVPVEVTPI